MIQTPLSVLCVLLAVLAGLFLLQRHPFGNRLFRTIPLLVFCYFIPALSVPVMRQRFTQLVG